MPFNKEISGFNPDENREQPEAAKPSGLTLADVRQYLVDHLHDSELNDEKDFILNWKPFDALPYFEMRCNSLREHGSPELYKVRQLTQLIDKETHSGGYVSTNKREVALLLMNYAAEELRHSPEEDSIGKQEAGAAYDARISATRAYEHIDAIESVLAMVEESISALNTKIDGVSREPNKNPRDEKNHRTETKALEKKREAYRRARIFLMDEYFPK